MEEEEGASLLFMHDEPRIRAPQSPVLSPSIVNLCGAYSSIEHFSL
jgi:hypothetical protein